MCWWSPGKTASKRRWLRWGNGEMLGHVFGEGTENSHHSWGDLEVTE